MISQKNSVSRIFMGQKKLTTEKKIIYVGPFGQVPENLKFFGGLKLILLFFRENKMTFHVKAQIRCHKMWHLIRVYIFFTLIKKSPNAMPAGRDKEDWVWDQLNTYTFVSPIWGPATNGQENC